MPSRISIPGSLYFTSDFRRSLEDGISASTDEDILQLLVIEGLPTGRSVSLRPHTSERPARIATPLQQELIRRYNSGDPGTGPGMCVMAYFAVV